MRNLVFSKFFKSAIKVDRCPAVNVYKRGIEIDFHPLHAWFDWPAGVTFDGCDLTVDSSIMASMIEMSEAHGGLASVTGERLPVEETEDGNKSERPEPAMMHVKFQDGAGFDCKASVCNTEYDFLHERARLEDEPTFVADVDSAEFARALKLVEPCVSKEENRPVLTTVYMDVHGGMLRFQSTDRFRMAVSCVRNAAIEHDGGDGFSCFTPVKIMKLFADKTIGNVRMECRDDSTGLGFTTFFGCELSGWNIVALNTMNGEFPNLDNCRQRGAAGYGCGFVCDVKQLKDVVAKLKTSKSNGLTFSIAANGIAVANELGVSYQVPAIGCGKADPNTADRRVLTVILNAHMLGELLTRVAAFGPSVEFLACNEVKPVWIGPVVDAELPFDVTGIDGEGYLLVPMRSMGRHDDVPVQPIGGFKPCASKLEPIVDLVDAPDWTFVDSVKPKRAKVEREQSQPRVQRKPVEHVEPVQQPEQTSKAVVVKREAAVERVEPVETVPAEVVESEPRGQHDVVTVEVVEPEPVAVKVEQPEQSEQRKPVEPEAVTREIPEVPPATEPHEVVRTSTAVVVRKVTIPGGKSVRELADVFGMYSHKPRGFRDSKGRRVAYVAFDRSSGVIAYRDYYTLDEKVERDIAAYCKRFGLRLAA